MRAKKLIWTLAAFRCLLSSLLGAAQRLIGREGVSILTDGCVAKGLELNLKSLLSMAVSSLGM